MNTTESVSNHTPGPWTASRGSRRSDVIDYIKVGAGFLSFTRGIGQTNAEVASNTRMAAAAPELLAAIAELLSQLEQGMECHDEERHFASPGRNRQSVSRPPIGQPLTLIPLIP